MRVFRVSPLSSLSLALAAGALTLGLGAAGTAQALPKKSQAVCNCSCDTGPNGAHQMTYAGMASCAGYNGKTCNVEVSPGIIRSGTLKNCGSGSRMTDSMASSAGKALSADPSKPQPPMSSKAPASAMSATKK
jgi:hypothetical protein